FFFIFIFIFIFLFFLLFFFFFFLFFSIVEFGNEMKKPEIDRCIHNLRIDFEPMEAFLLIRPIFLSSFTYDSLYNMQTLHDDKMDIQRGLQKYHFHSFYEGYHVQNIPTKDATTRPNGINRHKSGINRFYKSNYQYMSCVPDKFRSIDRTKGLGIMREAMVGYIKRHQGIPPYYFNDVLDRKLCHITK
ncbi:hypothetical protein BC940DRAFT_354046, partial [Gongronella butleri]